MVRNCGAWMARAKVDQLASHQASHGSPHMEPVRNTMTGALAITVLYSLETYSCAADRSAF